MYSIQLSTFARQLCHVKGIDSRTRAKQNACFRLTIESQARNIEESSSTRVNQVRHGSERDIRRGSLAKASLLSCRPQSIGR